MSLFGGGEDVKTYAQSKMSEFEAQLQKIAEVGETGVATGPQLPCELHPGSQSLNPIYYVEVH